MQLRTCDESGVSQRYGKSDTAGYTECGSNRPGFGCSILEKAQRDLIGTYNFRGHFGISGNGDAGLHDASGTQNPQFHIERMRGPSFSTAG